MVRYSSKSAKALGFLKRHYNDIEIYVEDTGCPQLWLVLLRRFLPEGVTLSSVNPLGGKEAVLKACRNDQKADGRKRLYVIDGDFDFALNRQKPRLKFLYRLRAYSVETLLLYEDAFVQLGLTFSSAQNDADVKQLFDFEQCIDEIERKLWPLFIIYLAANELSPSVKTVGRSASKLYEVVGQETNYSSRKVIVRAIQVAREICNEHSRADFSAMIRVLRQNVYRKKIREWVSSKDYIIPLLHIKVRKKLQFAGRIDNLKVFLANHVDPVREPYLARRLKMSLV